MQKNIDYALSIIKKNFGEHIFSSGNCHDLAFALYKNFGGSLLAIIRDEIDENGAIFTTTYSHMILELNGFCIDIDGENADERWCNMWSDEFDEDGLISEFNYINVSDTKIDDFLKEYKTSLNLILIEQLDSLIKTHYQ